MGFDPWNRSLKIRESIGTPTPQVGSLKSVRVHSLTLSYTPGSIRCASRASLLARTLASPCFGREPKARVAIMMVFVNVIREIILISHGPTVGAHHQLQLLK